MKGALVGLAATALLCACVSDVHASPVRREEWPSPRSVADYLKTSGKNVCDGVDLSDADFFCACV